MTEQDKFEQWYATYYNAREPKRPVVATDVKLLRKGSSYREDFTALYWMWEGWQGKAQYTGLDPQMGFILDAANEGELAAYDYGCEGMIDALTEVLDDTKGREGKSHPEWQKLKERVWKLMDKAAELDNFGWQ